MGLSTSIYLGPYIQVTHRDTTREVEVFGCMSPDCPEYAKRESGYRPAGRFCSGCASPMGKSTKVVPWRQWSGELFGDNEDLTEIPDNDQDKTVFLICNTSKGTPRDFHPDEQDAHEDLSAVDKGQEIQWFENRFAKEIGLLKGAYDNVTVKWGLHVWMS
jgi:hypothetical protein